ncbi:MAG TPA: hypothetical protein VNT29_06820 [Candidatus Limnocylindrales bacterium]|nr:hypothetical protein [Candidatus Limnocylindrales bacterium]
MTDYADDAMRFKPPRDPGGTGFSLCFFPGFAWTRKSQAKACATNSSPDKIESQNDARPARID